MPLKLEPYIPKRDYILSKTGKEIYVNPNLSSDILFDFRDIKDIDPENLLKKDFNRIEEVVKRILYNDKENKKEDIEELFEMASFAEKIK
ncbi:MAG: hypothetical protein V3U02_12920, partial [Calditrichia bacterium]